MTSMKQRFLVAGLAALVALGALTGATAALHLGPWRETAEPTLRMGPVIATVDGRPIYLHEAEARVEGLNSVHGNVAQTLGPQWPQTVLRSLVDDQILREQASALGVTVTAEDIEQSLTQIQDSLGTGQTLAEWLSQQRLSLQELERRIELQLIGSRVYLAVTEDVRVSAEELRAYYHEHLDELEDQDGTVPSLIEVRRTLRRDLLKDAKERTYAAWLEKQRATVDIEVIREHWWKGLA